jgi:hypothetical protein
MGFSGTISLMKKIILIFLLVVNYAYAENKYGAAKTGFYISNYGNFYTGVTYELPNFTKWFIGDIGYLMALENGEKSYYIAAISLDTSQMFNFNLKKALNVEKKWITLEPGFWVGYDVRTETKHKYAYGLKISLVDYEF